MCVLVSEFNIIFTYNEEKKRDSEQHEIEIEAIRAIIFNKTKTC